MKERERNIERLPLARTQLGTEPVTRACALTGDRTSDLWLCGKMLNQLSHTGQGSLRSILKQTQKELSSDTCYNMDET